MKHVTEQRHLLWGSEVAAYTEDGSGKPTRVLHVDDEHIGFATALALVVEHGRRAPEQAHKAAQARCPRCGKIGDAKRDFGTRLLNGKRRPQSWCRSCRKSHPHAARRHGAAPEPGWLFSPSDSR